MVSFLPSPLVTIKNTKIAGRILITGGTGSWGYELCRQLLTFSKIKEIIIPNI